MRDARDRGSPSAPIVLASRFQAFSCTVWKAIPLAVSPRDEERSPFHSPVAAASISPGNPAIDRLLSAKAAVILFARMNATRLWPGCYPLSLLLTASFGARTGVVILTSLVMEFAEVIRAR
ncbi:hypothetical protein KC322_g74 [Hortaea werneckii]|nr:hypothetical protein KC322_g74 [Hortaea werneckii]